MLLYVTYMRRGKAHSELVQEMLHAALVLGDEAVHARQVRFAPNSSRLPKCIRIFATSFRVRCVCSPGVSALSKICYMYSYFVKQRKLKFSCHSKTIVGFVLLIAGI